MYKKGGLLTGSLLFFILSGLLFTSCNAVKDANRKAEKDERNKVKQLYPDYPFDSVLAQKAIGYGNAKIEGVAFTKPKTKLGYNAPFEKRIYGAGIVVTLFPVTPYFEQWYELRRKKADKKTVVYMSDQAFRYRIEAKTDNYGRFKFERMKPGKYFLQTFVDWYRPVSYKEYTGQQAVNAWGDVTNYYQWKTYNENHSDRLEKFVEITQDGSVVQVTLK